MTFKATKTLLREVTYTASAEGPVLEVRAAFVEDPPAARVHGTVDHRFPLGALPPPLQELAANFMRELRTHIDSLHFTRTEERSTPLRDIAGAISEKEGRPSDDIAEPG